MSNQLYDDEECFEVDPRMFLNDNDQKKVKEVEEKDEMPSLEPIPSHYEPTKQEYEEILTTSTQLGQAYKYVETLVNAMQCDEDDFSDDSEAVFYYDDDEEFFNNYIEIDGLVLDKEIASGVCQIINAQGPEEDTHAKLTILAKLIVQRDNMHYSQSTGTTCKYEPARVKHGMIQREENGYSTALVGLVGGVKRRRKIKRRGKPRRRFGDREPMPQSRQEGQINSFTPGPKDFVSVYKFNSTIIADGAGIVNTRFNVRNPQRARDGSLAYVNVLDVGTMFDRYKVTHFIFQFSPTSPVQPGIIATAFDWDAPDSSTPNFANTINYANYKQFTASRGFSEKSRIPMLTEGTRDVEEARPVIIHQGGFLDFATPPVQGQFLFNAIQCTPLATIGSVICTMVIRARSRR